MGSSRSFCPTPHRREQLTRTAAHADGQEANVTTTAGMLHYLMWLVRAGANHSWGTAPSLVNACNFPEHGQAKHWPGARRTLTGNFCFSKMWSSSLYTKMCLRNSKLVAWKLSVPLTCSQQQVGHDAACSCPRGRGHAPQICDAGGPAPLAQTAWQVPPGRWSSEQPATDGTEAIAYQNACCLPDVGHGVVTDLCPDTYRPLGEQEQEHVHKSEEPNSVCGVSDIAPVPNAKGVGVGVAGAIVGCGSGGCALFALEVVDACHTGK
jgi:hypothetical protein